MKVKNLARLSVICLLIVGCDRQVSVNSPPETPVAQTPASASPRSTQRSQPDILKSGSFVPGEHPTSGTVRMVSENGKRYLEFGETFKTDSGPDLQVILHRSSNVIASTKPPDYRLKEGDYAIVAPLQKVSGTQRYAIPDDVKVEDYRSAAVWCRKFNATFGAAAFGK